MKGLMLSSIDKNFSRQMLVGGFLVKELATSEEAKEAS